MLETAPALSWMAIARAELGQAEIPGKKANPRIVEYASTTRLKATSDEVHWCSSFVNWCVTMAGLEGTDSAAAISWARWGYRLPGPKIGAIAVVPRNDPNNPNAAHVGFVNDYTPHVVYLLAGNQGNRVSVRAFPRSVVRHYRCPPGYVL